MSEITPIDAVLGTGVSPRAISVAEIAPEQVHFTKTHVGVDSGLEIDR